MAFAGLANGDTIQDANEAPDEELLEVSQMHQTRPPAPTLSSQGLAQPVGHPAAALSMPVAQGAHDDKYELGDGRAFILRWPASFSADEYEEFEAWIALLQKKLKRSIQQ